MMITLRKNVLEKQDPLSLQLCFLELNLLGGQHILAQLGDYLSFDLLLSCFFEKMSSLPEKHPLRYLLLGFPHCQFVFGGF